MNIVRLSWINIISNKLSTLLSVLLMTFGVGIISLLLLINHGVEEQLERNLGGVDMVVGAKGSPLQLILSTIYHIDNPTGNIPLKEAKKLKKHPLVSKAIPMSFGDSYGGFRIVGTTSEYVDLYEAKLDQGALWDEPLEVVLGSSAAQTGQLKLGDTFYGVHGTAAGGEVHEDHTYQVVGILSPTNSMLDELILTGLESVWRVHDHGDHQADTSHSSHAHHEDESHEHHDHDKEADLMITAMLVKFRNPIGLLQIPRSVNETTNMQAAVPAFEVNRLISLLGVGVQTINLIALVIIIVSGLSIFIGLYNALNKRRKEMALMRVQGATRWQLVQLVLLEAVMITFIGVVFGVVISRLTLLAVHTLFETTISAGLVQFGLLTEELWLLAVALSVGIFAAIIPTIQSYLISIPKTLADE